MIRRPELDKAVWALNDRRNRPFNRNSSERQIKEGQACLGGLLYSSLLQL
jgi:hypothetical protein